jgi:hypothetical protein
MARAVNLNEAKQDTVVTLVSMGLSRRRAALHVGCDPSTVSKLAARCEVFAERLIQARMQSEANPLELVKRHGDRSWRAAAWLLEKCHPQLYGKNASLASERALEDERLRVINVLQQEIEDPALLERIIDRLHELDEPQPTDEPPRETAKPIASSTKTAATPKRVDSAGRDTPPASSQQTSAKDSPQPAATTAATTTPKSAPQTSGPALLPRRRKIELLRPEELDALYPIRNHPDLRSMPAEWWTTPLPIVG